MRLIVLFILLTNTVFAQFTYSGYIYNADGSGAGGVPIKLYRRTNSTITGFTSQTNYNGHSYYRSTSSATWTNAKSNCEAMGGHLATISDASENNFLYNTWPSGWIGLYQDKTGAFYSEPNGGWRWTENDITDYSHNFDSKNYSSTLIDNIGGKNATMYNGPSLVTSGGNYVQFDGTNDYSITGNLAGSFPNAQEVQTLQLLCYPQSAGILVTELGVGSSSSGWHASVMEITTSGTLKVGFWNGTGISSISSSIAMNTWHLISMTYDGSTLRGYLDGVYFGAVTFNREVPHSNPGNGMFYSFAKSESTNMGNGNYGQYRLGYFRVFNRALTDDEIARSWMHISYRYGRMKYTNWNGGEPNNSGGEDYIQFVTSGRWNDLPNTSLPYVIEFDYIVTTSSWSLYKTIYTNTNGYYSVNEAYDPSKEYYIQIDIPTITQSLANSDAQEVSDLILGVTPKDGVSFYSFDVNNNNSLSVSDQYRIFGRKNGLFNSWEVPDLRLFTVAQYNTIKNSTTNLRSSIPGVTSVTTSTLSSGGSLSYYLIATGFAGKVDY